MASKHYTFSAKIWLYPTETAAWHFVTLPKDIGSILKSTHQANRRGFGSLPVSVTIGTTTWHTSIFPDGHSGSYLLPIKAAVRTHEELLLDDVVTVTLQVR